MSVYLLSGDPFLTSDALARLRVDEETDALSEVALTSSSTAADFLETLGTSTLFGGKRLVVVEDASSLKKDQLLAVEAFLADPAPDIVLVVVASGRTKLDQSVRKVGKVVNLEAPKGRRLAGWVRERAAVHDVRVDDRGAWTLLDSVGSDLRELDAALEQLGTAFGSGARIGEREVRSLFQRSAEERTYVFTDAVGERRLEAAMTALRRLLSQGEEPLVMLGSLTAHVRRLLRARPYADGSTRDVADVLAMPEWRAERVAKQARSFREDELSAALRLLAQVDVEMKGEFPTSEIPLERAVLRIVTGRVDQLLPG